MMRVHKLNGLECRFQALGESRPSLCSCRSYVIVYRTAVEEQRVLEQLGRSGSGVMRVEPRDLTLSVATSCWFVRNERGMTSRQRATSITAPRSNPEAYTTELSRNILRLYTIADDAFRLPAIYCK